MGSAVTGRRVGVLTENVQPSASSRNVQQGSTATQQTQHTQVAEALDQSIDSDQPTVASSNDNLLRDASREKQCSCKASRNRQTRAATPGPKEIFLDPTKSMSFFHPQRILSYVKFFLLQGVMRDCVTHASEALAATHARARRYDNRIEHVFTYAQVGSAVMMSIAHGSNDVANAVGPWVGAYTTWKYGFVSTETATPIWILVTAGLLLGSGFWFFGYHIIRCMGNNLTLMSPVRGFCVELGAAVTVLIASRLGLPVSTTQCVAGSVVGVALTNMTTKAVNWKQMGYIFLGWVLTLPCAGILAGSLMAMALNVPQFQD